MTTLLITLFAYVFVSACYFMGLLLDALSSPDNLTFLLCATPEQRDKAIVKMFKLSMTFIISTLLLSVSLGCLRLYKAIRSWVMK